MNKYELLSGVLIDLRKTRFQIAHQILHKRNWCFASYLLEFMLLDLIFTD